MILWRRNWKNAFQRLLVPVGYSDYDYHDPIIVGPNHELFIESFWHEFAQELISASPVKFDSLNIDGVRQSFSPCNNQPYKDSRWIKSSICPWIDLRTFKNPEEFLPSLKSSLRQDLRRQKRRIDAIGEAQFFVFTEADELQAMKELQVFLAVHARRWPMSYRAPRFHELLIKFCLPAKKIHFSVLRINGHSAAWHLSFIHQDRLCSYIPAQKEEFDNLSPGKVLLLKCIEDSIARGLSIYDFLRGEENYKTGWTDKAETLWSLKVDENHLTSRLRNIVVDRAKPVVKTILSMK
jgi:CelD/BcsL family acetyltransferase involved in cellulose biosynthesis